MLGHPPPLFVTGTDTNVGKTFVCACLMRLWLTHYWKPFQTGTDDDSRTVQTLSGCSADLIIKPFAHLTAPLSPLHAAEREGIVLDIDHLMPPPMRPLIIEGAGGVMVPITPDTLILDMIERWGAQTLVVARSTLGTLNHTLLTLQALKNRNIACLGVVMMGPAAPHNVRTLEDFTHVPVLAHVPFYEGPISEDVLTQALPLLGTLKDHLQRHWLSETA